ncbi:MAG: hypothetical protein KC496_18800 [Anaerolineae bacterium]|nr:hypothetical protein [Anaerolineae bacterium]
MSLSLEIEYDLTSLTEIMRHVEIAGWHDFLCDLDEFEQDFAGFDGDNRALASWAHWAIHSVDDLRYGFLGKSIGS